MGANAAVVGFAALHPRLGLGLGSRERLSRDGALLSERKRKVCSRGLGVCGFSQYPCEY